MTRVRISQELYELETLLKFKTVIAIVPFKDLEKKREYYKKYNKIWYQKNKAKRKKQIYKRKAKLKSWFKEYKATLSCLDCGNNNTKVLQFHHRISIGRYGKRVSYYLKSHSKKRIMEEVLKCDILCANCHLLRHH